MRQRIAYGLLDMGAMTLVEDDVLLQATSSRMLQELVDAASWLSGKKDSTWSIPKQSYPQPSTEQTTTLYI